MKIQFYPGGLWIKRIKHIAVLSAIGINLFMNNIQDFVLDEIERHTHNIGDASLELEVSSQVKGHFEKLQEGSWKEFWLNTFRSYYVDLPSPQEVNEAIESYNRVNENLRYTNENILLEIGEIDRGLELVIMIVQWTSFLMWIPISISALWIGFDLKKGNVPKFIGRCLLLALVFNIISYVVLDYYVATFLEGIPKYEEWVEYWEALALE